MAVAHRSAPRSTVSLPHLPALDGLRGLAVALVVAYHLNPSLVPGGFLGVDVFFVLSGFLITSLAVTEVGERGGFRVGAFYLRRARRLLPALLLVLLAVGAYAQVWADATELGRLRQHALWTLAYLANWRFIIDGTTYTDALHGASPLRHTWSLAIEEQFYIVFPLLVLTIGKAVRWQTEALRRALGVVAVGGAVASAAWMALLWGDGSDPSRGYFGTDTRIHSLLVGVLLGLALVGRPVRRGPSARAAAIAAVAGTAGLLAATLVAHEDAAWLQRGGFLAVALSTAAIIAGSERVRPLKWLLTRRPLVALGLISYGVYLWHWPVIVVLDEARTGLRGPALSALRIVVTLAAASLSFVLVEQPIRRLRAPTLRWRPAVALSGAAMATVVGVVIASTAVPAPERLPPRQASAVPTGGHPSVDLPVGVVYFGDSVARSLAGAPLGHEPYDTEWSPFDPALVVAQSTARSYCTYLEGYQVLRDGDLNQRAYQLCGGWRGELVDVLEAGQQQFVLVALTNDADPRVVDGQPVDVGSARHQAILDSFLDELREVARGHGAELVLLSLPPRPDTFVTELDHDGGRERAMRRELAAYAARRPGVAMLDLFEAVCPGGDCSRPPPGFDPDWRADERHFSPAGARWVADWLTPQLLDLLERAGGVWPPDPDAS